jgi:hypothetical protein
MWVAALVACLLMLGCRKPAETASGMTVACRVAPEPPRVGPATVTLTLTGTDGKPLTGATVRVEGNMSHAGMKPVFGDATEGEPGEYEAPLEFTMGGDWFLIVTATLPDGRRLERQVEVPGVQAR